MVSKMKTMRIKKKYLTQNLIYFEGNIYYIDSVSMEFWFSGGFISINTYMSLGFDLLLNSTSDKQDKVMRWLQK